MFVIPLAMRLGAPITARTFVVNNLIPATIGNLIGGGVFVATAMALSYGSLEKRINAAGARMYRRIGGPDCGLVVFGAANAPAKDGSSTHSQQSSGSSSDIDSAAAHAVVQQLAGVRNSHLKSVAVHSAAV